MEGETGSSINAEMLYGERVLPTLDSNIKSGNSLIDMDFYDGQIDFEPELEKKVKPFSWEKGFAEVFKHGGFDAVIGNPPYVTIGGKEDTLFFKDEVEYLLSKYLSNQYKPNLYAFFYEKGLNILKKDGLVSFIVPRTIIDNIYYKTLREHFRNKSLIIKLLKLNYEVFGDATTGGTSICVFQKSAKKNSAIKCFDINSKDEFSSKKPLIINQEEILIGDNKSFSFSNPTHQLLINKILKENPKLEFFCSVNNGVNTGNAANVLLYEKAFNNKYRKILEGKNINRYTTNWKGLWINYDTTLKSRIKLEDLKTKQNKIDFALRDSRIFDSEKIIIRQTADRIIGQIDNDKYISRHSTHCILNDYEPINLKFLLAILNSKLIDFCYTQLIPEKGKVFAEVKAINVKQLPIKKIDEKNKSEKSLHNEIVNLVETMLQLQQQKQTSTLPNQLQQVEQRIAYTDEKINEKVYSLYGLTEEEVRLVEGG